MAERGRLASLLRTAARPDLMVVLLVVLTIALMIIPLPTLAIDALLAVNMALSVLLLVVALYVRTPVEFSTLPALILIGTVFRLALNITTTRLILLEAEGSAIITTFGDFVIAGNVLVGLVIFLIITVVQFVVITKGAERVAEVAARFSLDALPGKQMSIDADLRNGDIDQAEARRRRRALEKESSLFGAMDGAMKFVKGDAVAGLVIIVVNLLGGIAVGALQHGMTLGQSAAVYSVLTVGDGLVSQIPALFMSITAGAVITRVSGDGTGTLGSELSVQLFSDPRTLGLAALITLLLGLVPGFPLPIFLFLAAVLGGLALLVHRRAVAAAPPAAASAAAVAAAAEPPARVTLALGQALAEAAPPGDLAAALAAVRARAAHELGVGQPGIAHGIDPQLADDEFRIDVDGVPVAGAAFAPDALHVADTPAMLALAGIDAVPAPALPGLPAGELAAVGARAQLERAGIAHRDAVGVLAAAVGHTLARYAPQFMGLAEARAVLAQAEAALPDLVREVAKALPAARLAEVFRRLLDEGVGLADQRAVLEALAEWASREQDPAALAEAVRQGMRRRICFGHADRSRVISAVIVEQEAEAALRQALRQGPGGVVLALPEPAARELVARLRSALPEEVMRLRPPPVLLCGAELRRHLRGFLVRQGMDVAVLSHAEIAPEFVIQPLGAVQGVAGAARRPGLSSVAGAAE